MREYASTVQNKLKSKEAKETGEFHRQNLVHNLDDGSSENKGKSGIISLIDEKALKTKKARMNKEVELKNHTLTVNSLKRKLAKQIVNKTLKIEEFKQLTLEDLFKHANEMDHEKHERKKSMLAIFNNPDD